MAFWTGKERLTALRLFEEGLPIQEIANRLGRTRLAVKRMLDRERKRGVVQSRRQAFADLDVSKAHPIQRQLHRRAVADGHNYYTLERASGHPRTSLKRAFTGNPGLLVIVALAEALDTKLTIVANQYDHIELPDVADATEERVRELHAKGLSPAVIMERLGVSNSHFYRIVGGANETRDHFDDGTFDASAGADD